MKDYKFISAIIQIVLSLVLIGIGVYYFTIDEMMAALLFVIIGVVLIVLSARTIYKHYKNKKDGEDK